MIFHQHKAVWINNFLPYNAQRNNISEIRREYCTWFLTPNISWNKEKLYNYLISSYWICPREWYSHQPSKMIYEEGKLLIFNFSLISI